MSTHHNAWFAASQIGDSPSRFPAATSVCQAGSDSRIRITCFGMMAHAERTWTQSHRTRWCHFREGPMKHLQFAVTIVTVLVLGVSTTAFAEKVLRVATLQGAAQPSYKGLVKMAELVQQRTKGDLRIQV